MKNGNKIKMTLANMTNRKQHCTNTQPTSFPISRKQWKEQPTTSQSNQSINQSINQSSNPLKFTNDVWKYLWDLYTLKPENVNFHNTHKEIQKRQLHSIHFKYRHTHMYTCMYTVTHTHTLLLLPPCRSAQVLCHFGWCFGIFLWGWLCSWTRPGLICSCCVSWWSWLRWLWCWHNVSLLLKLRTIIHLY